MRCAGRCDGGVKGLHQEHPLFSLSLSAYYGLTGRRVNSPGYGERGKEMKSTNRVERESVVTCDKSIGKNERLEWPWRKSEFNAGQLLL